MEAARGPACWTHISRCAACSLLPLDHSQQPGPGGGVRLWSRSLGAVQMSLGCPHWGGRRNLSGYAPHHWHYKRDSSRLVFHPVLPFGCPSSHWTIAWLSSPAWLCLQSPALPAAIWVYQSWGTRVGLRLALLLSVTDPWELCDIEISLPGTFCLKLQMTPKSALLGMCMGGWCSCLRAFPDPGVQWTLVLAWSLLLPSTLVHLQGALRSWCVKISQGSCIGPGLWSYLKWGSIEHCSEESS